MECTPLSRRGSGDEGTERVGDVPPTPRYNSKFLKTKAGRRANERFDQFVLLCLFRPLKVPYANIIMFAELIIAIIGEKNTSTTKIQFDFTR